MRFLVCLFAFLAVASAELARLEKVHEQIGGQYIVVLKDKIHRDNFISSMEVGLLARETQPEIVYKYDHALNGFSVRIPDLHVDWVGLEPKINDESLRGLDGVDFIEEAGIVRPTTNQNNPPSWGLDRVNQENLPLDKQYSYQYCGSGVNVYVIDSGIRHSHYDFNGRAHFFWDYRNGDGKDCNGHGTHCAGTIAGSSYGMAKCANLYNVRVFPCSGGASSDIIVAGMDAVLGGGRTPAVVSMSLGGGASSTIDRAVRNLHNAGFVVSVAAGNDNANACNYSPARVAEAITVGATDSSDARSSFSNYGNCVDLFAPGSSITSAWYRSDSDSSTISGTSMACPHVSGACAKILQYAPGYSSAEVASVLINNSAKNKLSNIGRGSPNILLYQPY